MGTSLLIQECVRGMFDSVLLMRGIYADIFRRILSRVLHANFLVFWLQQYKTLVLKLNCKTINSCFLTSDVVIFIITSCIHKPFEGFQSRVCCRILFSLVSKICLALKLDCIII